MMKSGKLFQKSIILTEKKLDLHTRLIACMLLKKLTESLNINHYDGFNKAILSYII